MATSCRCRLCGLEDHASLAFPMPSFGMLMMESLGQASRVLSCALTNVYHQQREGMDCGQISHRNLQGRWNCGVHGGYVPCMQCQRADRTECNLTASHNDTHHASRWKNLPEARDARTAKQRGNYSVQLMNWIPVP